MTACTTPTELGPPTEDVRQSIRRFVQGICGLSSLVFGCVIAVMGLACLERGHADDAAIPVSTSNGTVDEFRPDADEVALRERMNKTIAARPEWVKESSQAAAGGESVLISSGPFVTAAEARQALAEKLEQATADYLVDLLGNPLAPKILRYDAKYIQRHLVPSDRWYDESQWFSVGEMRQSYALLEFDADFREEAQQRWQRVVTTSRLGQIGLGFAGLFTFLLMVFGYLRADTATRGYYSKRLQFATAVAILGLLVAGLMITKHIQWL
ncbi:MAG: hypothetical protein FJ295_02185 [Planctomycetes bacterium]|nr:hypothetical protein [Planctomycetota bacterium]